MPELYTLLDELEIPYERFDHAPVFTCDEAEAALPNNPAVQTKNIFLRDKRGRTTNFLDLVHKGAMPKLIWNRSPSR